MADQNTFNFENYTQGQTIYFSNEQVFQGDNQIFNQNEAQIDPSIYFIEGNTVPKETIGFEKGIINNDLFNQSKTLQDNIMDTNIIYGDAYKTGTEVPEYLEQRTSANNITNAVKGINYFGSTTNPIQVAETNFDTEGFFINNNPYTKTIFEQAQPIQATTKAESNIFFNQNPASIWV